MSALAVNPVQRVVRFYEAPIGKKAIMAVTGLIGIVGEAGLGPAVVQRRSLSPALLATVFWAGLVVGIGQFGLLWMAAPPVAVLLRQPALVGILRSCAVVAFGSG